jgi:beta-lactamase regulating signal transducer with metallopeptidase domain
MNVQVLEYIKEASNIVIPILERQMFYSTILFIVVFVVTRFLKKKSPHWHVGLWMIVLLRFVLPPDLSIPFSGRNLVIHLSSENHLERSVHPSDRSTASSEGSDISPERSHPWKMIAFLLWGSGCFVFLGIYVKQLFNHYILIKHASPVQDTTILNILQKCRSRLGVKRAVRLVSSDQSLSPFTMGIIRPVIYLPNLLVNSDRKTLLQAILAHETAHIKCCDDLWFKLQHIVQILYFFHPAVWYANRQINLSRECLCDSIALSKCNMSTRTYGGSLLTILKLTLVGAEEMRFLPSFSSQQKNMKHRIQNLKGEHTMRKYHVLFVYASLLLFGVFFLPMADSVTQASDATEVNFVAPVREGHISCRFGPSVDPITKTDRFHQGIDIAAKEGTEIYAVADGVVASAISQVQAGGLYGKNIIIQHEDEYTSRYAKLSKVLVKDGQTVKAGERIGLSGNTGRTTGPHLHFELMKNGEYEDPETYIDFTILQD